jgi:hypothetical protein
MVSLDRRCAQRPRRPTPGRHLGAGKTLSQPGFAGHADLGRRPGLGRAVEIRGMAATVPGAMAAAVVGVDAGVGG